MLKTNKTTKINKVSSFNIYPSSTNWTEFRLKKEERTHESGKGKMGEIEGNGNGLVYNYMHTQKFQ